MLFASRTQRLVLIAAAGLYWGNGASAIVRWNEGKEQIYVNASATASWDSNIYTIADGDGDFVYTGHVGAEYRRDAGLIGVNADVGITLSEFLDNKDESSTNPTFRLELTKDTGRTTGTFSLNAQRSSRADPVANLRTDSWNYDSAVNYRYPMSERVSLAGGITYGGRNYTDNTTLVDLNTYSLATDVFYVWRSDRDLVGGYRVRFSETSVNESYTDHAFTLGMSGRILPKLNGTLRGGIQTRSASGADAEDFTGYNASGTVTWNLTRKSSLTGQISKDFSTTSTNITLDATSFTLDTQYAFNAKFVLLGGVGYGINDFLGTAGGGRSDTYFSAYARAAYNFSEKLRLALEYSYYRNWSTDAFADFSRDSLSFNVDTRF